MTADLETRLQRAAEAHCPGLTLPRDLGLRLVAEVFASDGNEEDRWIEATQNACPACGGSGHKGDCAAPLGDAVAAARVLLADDVALSKMAEAVHDGPLGADEYWFSAATPQGGWCVDVVRAALRALAEVKP